MDHLYTSCINYIYISVNYLCRCPRNPLDVCPIKHQTHRELIVCLPPRIRYIDSRLMRKVRDISSNKVSCCRGRGAWYNSIRVGLRLIEISLQSTTTTRDVDTTLFTEFLIPHQRCCSPEGSHQSALHAFPIPKSHYSIVTSL